MVENVARILSIDGGGIRGIFPARILSYIEDATNRPIADLFHLIAGTSTGGIIAGGIATPRAFGDTAFSAQELLELYMERGAEIFTPSSFSMFGFLEEKYKTSGIKKILKEKFGDTMLSQSFIDILIPSYNLDRKPYFFKSWKAQGRDLDENEQAQQHEFRMTDVLRATSAAPTFFEPALIKNILGEEFALIDGGVFANNPAMCALASARKIYPRAVHFVVVSIGTGVMNKPIKYEDAKDWGLIGWTPHILNVISDGVNDATDYQLRQILGEVGKERYFRLQFEIMENDFGSPSEDMDDVTPENMNRLVQKANALIYNESEMLENIINQLSAKKTPLEELF